jgi:hypothetical protein
MNTKVNKALAGSTKIAPVTDPMLVDLVIKCIDQGWQVINQHGGILFTDKDFKMFVSKVSKTVQCYWLGYGHCAVFCPLQDFDDADHIIIWQKQQRLLDLTEPPEIRLGNPELF